MEEKPFIEVIQRNIVWQSTMQTVEVLLLEANGHRLELATMKGLDGAVIFALNAQNQVAFIESYRVVIGRTLVELPAGKIAPTEDPLAAAKRELEEETGLTAGTWEALGTAYGSQGLSDWRCHYFLATDLVEGKQQLQPDENPSFRWIAIEQTRALIEDNTICDNFSIVGIAKALFRLQGEPARLQSSGA
ncbi:MAG: NUDIX hydrolase [Candidatus Obscuribacterales bacterium]|nr:NUDIX hydrolase [Candidatus Obscuribacterales bacterium]